MRPSLAEELLVKLMNWTADRVADERPLLQAMASYKLDEYQQFGPGMRYTESLVNWLSQFETIEEREIALEFVKTRLVFISENQLFQLINICYSTQIQSYLLRKTAKQLNKCSYELNAIISSPEYQRNTRSSVFIGLSDGARIDYFRRASRVNNEQVLMTYAVNTDKTQEMVSKLTQEYYGASFDSLFLIDDFTASGQTFIRKEGDIHRGKLIKTFHSIFDKNQPLHTLVKDSPFEVHIIFYIATSSAVEHIDNELQIWKQANHYEFIHTVNTVQELPKSFNEPVLGNTPLKHLCEKYFDQSLADQHLLKGGLENIFLGYNGGALPLVLSHNTPNNSLPILWSPDDKNFQGLFPRVSRHN